jgi:hypothetical protein
MCCIWWLPVHRSVPSIPATSMHSERLFFTSINKLRFRLLSHNDEILVFLDKNADYDAALAD